jgi:hypothetical protein
MTYINHTNEELEFDIEQFEKQLARAQSEVTRLQRVLENAQTELTRRKLEALWQRNAEGLRLAVGDNLLVTEEYNNLQPNGWNFTGEIHEIVSLEPIGNDELSITCERVYLAAVPLPIARRMREAYLQAHGEAVE